MPVRAYEVVKIDASRLLPEDKIVWAGGSQYHTRTTPGKESRRMCENKRERNNERDCHVLFADTGRRIILKNCKRVAARIFLHASFSLSSFFSLGVFCALQKRLTHKAHRADESKLVRRPLTRPQPAAAATMPDPHSSHCFRHSLYRTSVIICTYRRTVLTSTQVPQQERHSASE